MFTDDYGQLSAIARPNATLRAMPLAENRVVFFGDSITDIWKLADYFPGKPYVNRGIGGQTTPQMLVRFRQDVIDLHPKVVVILAGTNDIAGNTAHAQRGHRSQPGFNGRTGAANGIRVVFSSLLPVHNYTAQSKRLLCRSVRRRDSGTEYLAQRLLRQERIVYLDYFSRVGRRKGMMKKELADDGLHPNDAGFKIMAPLAEAAIGKAMAARP